MPTILIVDDEKEMRELIRLMLERQGWQVYEASNGQYALDVLAQLDCDAVLLDIMMPGMDGFTVCEKIRQQWNMAILFLSARDSEEDKIRGLRLGGDDFIVKPFSSGELIARIEAVLRRVGVASEKSIKPIIQLDHLSRTVAVEGKKVIVTMKEFDLLATFMSHPNVVYTREQLLEKVWSIDYAGGTRTVDTHIKTLRIKLGKEASKCIETVWGVGYRFVEYVR